MVFGEKLQNLRKAKGYTQEQLAEAADISRQTLSKWELGTAKPDADNIVVISKIFGVSTDYLLIDDYDSDEDIPAVRQNSQKISAHYKSRLRLTVGAVITGVSLAALLILGIIGSVMPVTHTEISGGYEKTYYGLMGFLKYSRLEWLFILFIAAAVSGIALIIHSVISEKSRKTK
ncbi:MAG: helix-turn-helix transcriptional regulator [Butyrivibrio sp.]|nr:helix-turn-helix transcriptional regulator [Butyrivibrio sp.]